MKHDRTPFELPSELSTMVAQSVEQAHKAVNTYLQFIQSSISAAPWAKTELNKKLGMYAEQNVPSAFAFAKKLFQSKNLQDLTQIQTEFMQMQIQALSDQAKDLGEAASKEATNPFNGLSTYSS